MSSAFEVEDESDRHAAFAVSEMESFAFARRMESKDSHQVEGDGTGLSL